MVSRAQKHIGEFELIRWIRDQVRDSESLAGIGDDCSVQRLDPNTELLTSTDLLIEDIHFKRAWTSMFDLGRKSVAVNLSDIAAMGGTPKTLYLGIGRSKQLGSDELKDFLKGFLAEAACHKVILAGGDTCASPGPLMISVTVQGSVAVGKSIFRHGARSGDSIYVSGTLGDSALALQMLQAGRTPPTAVARRFHTPTARVELGRYLGLGEVPVHAMLDVSDGLLADLGHVLTASGTGAELELKALPLSDDFRRVLMDRPELIDLALAGGEDYELLLTSSRPDLTEVPALRGAITKIGTITARPGITIRQADGSDYRCRRAGFDHFAE